jgi:hypothetical protein
VVLFSAIAGAFLPNMTPVPTIPVAAQASILPIANDIDPKVSMSLEEFSFAKHVRLTRQGGDQC